MRYSEETEWPLSERCVRTDCAPWPAPAATPSRVLVSMSLFPPPPSLVSGLAFTWFIGLMKPGVPSATRVKRNAGASASQCSGHGQRLGKGQVQKDKAQRLSPVYPAPVGPGMWTQVKPWGVSQPVARASSQNPSCFFII